MNQEVVSVVCFAGERRRTSRPSSRLGERVETACQVQSGASDKGRDQRWESRREQTREKNFPFGSPLPPHSGDFHRRTRISKLSQGSDSCTGLLLLCVSCLAPSCSSSSACSRTEVPMRPHNEDRDDDRRKPNGLVSWCTILRHLETEVIRA